MIGKLFTAALLILAATAARAADGQPVQITGSTTVANSIVLPHQADIETLAGVKIAVMPSSSGRGVDDLVSGKADIAMISADLDEILVENPAVFRAYQADRIPLRPVRLGEGARVEFIVNASNPVRKLSAQQIKAIYLGKITDWSEVGGAASKIAVYSESRHGAMYAMVDHGLLSSDPMASSVTETGEAPQVAEVVAKAPNGVGFISSATPAALRSGTAAVETDARLVQRLSLVTLGEPRGEVARVVDAIKQMK